MVSGSVTPPSNRFEWRPDPYGRHAWRFFADGVPTEHVRDGDRDGIDPLPGQEGPRDSGPGGPPYPPPSWPSWPDPDSPPPLWQGYTGRGRPLPEPVPPEGGPWTLYRSDLVWSAKAIASAPALLALTVALTLLSEAAARIPVAGGLVAIALSLFVAGFTGTLRVWFLRIARHRSFGSAEFWHLTGAFMGRFIVLGLVVLVPLGVLAGIGVGIWLHEEAFHITTNPLTGAPKVPTSYTIVVAVVVLTMTLVTDVILTFVVPALSFTTRSTRRGLRLGFRLLRRTWPQCAWYVFAPGLTFGLLAVVIPQRVLGYGPDILVGLVGATVGLWFRGAIAALYLRSFPQTPDNGAGDLRD